MTSKERNVAFKTMAMKARVANYFRSLLYKKDITTLTQEEKDQVLNSLFSMINDMHQELHSYKTKRKAKARIEKLREERKLNKA